MLQIVAPSLGDAPRRTILIENVGEIAVTATNVIFDVFAGGTTKEIASENQIKVRIISHIGNVFIILNSNQLQTTIEGTADITRYIGG